MQNRQMIYKGSLVSLVPWVADHSIRPWNCQTHERIGFREGGRYREMVVRKRKLKSPPKFRLSQVSPCTLSSMISGL